jgi:hypothetical protein
MPLTDVQWSRAGRHEVSARLLALQFALDNPLSQQSRRLGLVTVLNWLEAQPGGTWQERWLPSGAEAHQDWRNLVAAWKGDGLTGPDPGTTRPGNPGQTQAITGWTAR